MKTQGIIWLRTNTEKKIWTFLSPANLLSILSSFFPLVNISLVFFFFFFFFWKESVPTECDENWSYETPISIPSLRIVSSYLFFFFFWAKFVHLNFKDFVSWSIAQGKKWQNCLNPKKATESKAEARCRTGLIPPFLFPKPLLFIVVVEIL